MKNVSPTPLWWAHPTPDLPPAQAISTTTTRPAMNPAGAGGRERWTDIDSGRLRKVAILEANKVSAISSQGGRFSNQAARREQPAESRWESPIQVAIDDRAEAWNWALQASQPELFHRLGLVGFKLSQQLPVQPGDGRRQHGIVQSGCERLALAHDVVDKLGRNLQLLGVCRVGGEQ